MLAARCPRQDGPTVGRGLKEDVEGLDDENTKIASIHVSLRCHPRIGEIRDPC